MSIFNGQDQLRIRLTTSVNITSATVLQVRYRKPDGTLGNWTATEEDPTNGIIFYDVQSGDIDLAGKWRFWAFVTFSDGRSAPGESVGVIVYKPGGDP